MGWEDILKGLKFDYAILRQVVEEVILDKDNFESFDILEEVQKKYNSEMRRLGRRFRHKKITKGTVGKILGQIETIKKKNVAEYIEGKRTGRIKVIYRKVEE